VLKLELLEHEARALLKKRQTEPPGLIDRKLEDTVRWTRVIGVKAPVA
jgi:hypothetical protein